MEFSSDSTVSKKGNALMQISYIRSYQNSS